MEVIPPASPWPLTPTTEDVASLSFPVSFSAWREGTALRQLRFQMAREHRARLEVLCQSISLHTRPSALLNIWGCRGSVCAFPAWQSFDVL